MRRYFRAPPLWLLVLLAACTWLVWHDGILLGRVEFVSGQPLWSTDELGNDSQSSTGYRQEMRRLIVPEHNNEAYLWIMQTQSMLASGNWRIHHVEHDNAPRGRELKSSVLFRFWFGLVAWCDHALSVRSLGLATEHAALLTGPLLHFLLLISTTLFVARQFGGVAAALLCTGLVTMFPLVDGFLPGVPDHRDLANALILWSLLLLLAGLKNSPMGTGEAGGTPSSAGWFFSAGTLSGLGLWVDVTLQVPVLCGLGLGGLVAAFIPGKPTPTPLDRFAGWRWWALGGALACGIAWFVDNSAGMTGTHLRVTPMHGLAWIVMAELLGRCLTVRVCAAVASPRKQWTMILLFSVVLIALVIILRQQGAGFWADDVRATRLGNSVTRNGAENFGRWFLTEGMNWTVAAVSAPLLLIALAAWQLCRRGTGFARRIMLAILLGPVVVGLSCSMLQIRWWHTLDICALALVVGAVAQGSIEASERACRWIFSLGLVAALGLVPVMMTVSAARSPELTAAEAVAVIERDLAVWLARHGGPNAIVLASPNLTDSFCFHGGLRGLGTLFPENREGLNAAIRTAAATTSEEAQELLLQREVTHLVFVSWDSILEEYAQTASHLPQATFVAALRRWEIPTWLRPVPYYFPLVAGLEKTAVTVFTVVEEQRETDALARVVEYFLETGQAVEAEALGRTLRRFPGNINAQIAIAQTCAREGKTAEFSEIFETLVSGCAAGADRSLAWDRRVSLVIVLAQGKRMDLVAGQIKACLRDANAERLRALSVSTLRRFLILCAATHSEWSDHQLRQEAIDLIPPAMRLSLPP